MLAIIDGDVLCYSVCESRWEKKAKIVDGISYVMLDSEGKRIPLEFTKEEDRAYLEESWTKLKSTLGILVDKLFCSDFVMAVKGEDNFRNRIYPEYKLNRHSDPNKQNMFVPVLRKLLVAEDLAIAADGMEADDLVRIWAEQARSAGIDYIICSIDKDLKCIPGKHFYLRRGKERMFEITEEEALRHYYFQLLKGDPTDNIPGVLQVGDVKAKRILAPYNSEEDFQEQVVEQYMSVYGDNWYEHLLMNGRMIHLCKHPNDYFNPGSWEVVKAIREM